MEIKWNKTSEVLPVEDGPYFAVYKKYKTVKLLHFNSYDKCWDDDQDDDYYCEIEEVSHWIKCPESPFKKGVWNG